MTEEYVSEYNDSVRAEQCYFCPKRTDLQTHHIVPQRKNGSNRKENLVIVCERCHQKLEDLYDQRFYERLGLSDLKGEERTHFSCTNGDCDKEAIARTSRGVWVCKEHTKMVIESGFDHPEKSGWDTIEKTVIDKSPGEIVEQVKQDLIASVLDEVSLHRDITRSVQEFAVEEARRTAPIELKGEVAYRIIEEYAANPEEVLSRGAKNSSDQYEWLDDI